MPHAPEMTGCLLDGRYELHDIVGEGTFGRVYRARDRRLDRIVAVKLIKPWWAEDPRWASTFEREARLLARLSDPGIVQIFDVGQAPEGLYYVAELVEGESLASLLERDPLDPADACGIAEQLCRALASAHAQGIVHRDVKPANVLISAEGRVKLGDFGVARLAEGSTGGTAGGVLGTPRYMAPEQARGIKTTPATDVYSVGAVLYEMLSGAPPFTGDSAIELALSHVHDPPPPLPERVPRALAQIAERALAKDPRERYQDGRAIAAALARARRSLRSNGRSHSLRAPPTVTDPPPDRRPGVPDATRVAPRLAPRRRFNPAARRRSAGLLGLALLLLAAMILGAVLLAPPEHMRVPRLIGLTRGAISKRVHPPTLRLSFASRYDEAAPGTAIAQRPLPGKRVNEGSTIRVTLSAGPPPVEVPRLVGQASTSARAILGSLGLAASVASGPAPGVQPGTVTAQSPVGGHYLRAHSSVALTVAEAPRWRPLTSFAGTDGGQSVPFRIRGSQWRITYRMAFAGTCTLIFFCDGPSARIVGTGSGSTVNTFGMNDGGDQTEIVRAGPGVYQLQITPGSDTARWSIRVADYY